MLSFKRIFIPLFLLILIIDLSRFLFKWPSGIDQNPAPDFASFAAGQQRKTVFFEYFEPIVSAENALILEQRARVLSLFRQRTALNRSQFKEVVRLADHYQVDEFNPDIEQNWITLLRRIDVIPVSLALAQAANESAWGTSRFATQASNYFGHWCFVKGCGLIPKKRDTGKNHEVAKFDSPQESVQKYLLNLNTHYAYENLRIIREDLRTQDKAITGMALLPALLQYSERGQHYIDELKDMIKYNNLNLHDA